MKVNFKKLNKPQKKFNDYYFMQTFISNLESIYSTGLATHVDGLNTLLLWLLGWRGSQFWDCSFNLCIVRYDDSVTKPQIPSSTTQ